MPFSLKCYAFSFFFMSSLIENGASSVAILSNSTVMTALMTQVFTEAEVFLGTKYYLSFFLVPHSVCSRSCKLLVRKLHSDKQRSLGWCTNWTTCLRWRAIRKFMEWTGYHLVAQSCLTLRDHVDCSPPGFSVYGVSQATILEWVAIPTSRGSSRPGVSCLGRLILCSWTTGETLKE